MSKKPKIGDKYKFQGEDVTVVDIKNYGDVVLFSPDSREDNNPVYGWKWTCPEFDRLFKPNYQKQNLETLKKYLGINN